MIRRFLALLLCLTMLPRVSAEGLPDLGESAQAEISPAVERRVGESFMRELRYRDPAYLNDQEVEDYLNQIGGKLVAASQDVRQEFDFFAIRDNSLNAFAWPGGFIGVHTGLIMAAQSESELAAVLAHEVSHVTQRHIVRMVSKQGQTSMLALAGLVIAILAGARGGNSQVPEAAVAATQAAAIQSQISYTREFEREADRVGFQTLEASGFDVHGMSAFFERLQKYGRAYDNNAPGYLRTHPLTTERIADAENRAASRPYKQVLDSLDFQLVRAKLRSQQGSTQEAVQSAQSYLSNVGANNAAAHYGLARAQLRAKNYAGAEKELAELRRLKATSPMVEGLAAELRIAQNDPAGAAKLYKDARTRFPASRALTYGQIDTLLTANQSQDALNIATRELSNSTRDPKLYGYQARAYAALGKQAAQHRAQGEMYALQGNLPAAIDQLQIAQRAKDGDFYEQSAVDAKLREYRQRQAEELKDKRAGGGGP